MQGVETLKVQIAPIHHVERAGFRQDPVKDIHVMQFSIGNLNESGDGATQVQQRMHLQPLLWWTETRAHGKTDKHRSMVVAVERLESVPIDDRTNRETPPSTSEARAVATKT